MRQLVCEKDFNEIYTRCQIVVCGSQYSNGLYQRTRAGEVKNFTGNSLLYEPPGRPDLKLYSGAETLELYRPGVRTAVATWVDGYH